MTDDGSPHPAPSERAGGDASATDPRARILRATQELIAEVGWNRTTTRMVAERASVNNALLHYYFGTKRALLLRAASDALLTEFAGVFSAFGGERSLAEGFRDAMRWLAQAGPSSGSARIIIETTLQAAHDPEMQETMRAILRDFRRLIAERAEAQGMEAAAARGLATVLAAVLDGLYLHVLLDEELDVAAASAALDPLLPKEES